MHRTTRGPVGLWAVAVAALFVTCAGGADAAAVSARDILCLPPDASDGVAVLDAAVRACPSLGTVVVPVLPGVRECVPVGVVERAHAAGLRVLGGLTLYALPPGAATPSVPGPRGAGLLERPHGVPCGVVPDGPFTSPWMPGVRDRLAAAAKALGRQAPPIDGLYLDPRLSPSLWWGFSNAARMAYIDHAGVDPFDLPLMRVSPERHPRLRAWMEWRLATAGDMLREVVEAFRRARPEQAGEASVALVCSPQSPVWPLSDRARLLEDWAPWCIDGLVEELVFDVGLGSADPSADVRRGLALADRLGLADRVWLRVPGSAGVVELPIGDVYSRMRALDLPEMPLLLDPSTGEQLNTVLRVMQEVTHAD